jgi:hypothetical protein
VDFLNETKKPALLVENLSDETLSIEIKEEKETSENSPLLRKIYKVLS